VRQPFGNPEPRPNTQRSATLDMPKALHFKGDKKVKKKKRPAEPYDANDAPSKALVASAPAEGTEDDDTWVTADAPSDISGPIVIVLPTNTPTSLACDANGKVFASALENIVDGDANTAEPHDVRQVFVANRVAGTESLSLKGHHGRCVVYLSRDLTPDLH
jgi:protein FRG1